MAAFYLNCGLRVVIVACICIALAPDCGPYSVLSHEALIDALWDTKLNRPTLGDRTLALIVKVLPPIGPLRNLKLKIPTPVEKLFTDSFDRSAKQFVEKITEAMNGSLELEPKNYDVGVVTLAGSYRLDDQAQCYWFNLARN